MTKIERRLVFAVVGVVAAEAIIEFAQWTIPKVSTFLADLLLRSEFIRRLIHSSDSLELLLAVTVGILFFLPILLAVFFLSALLVGRGSLKDGLHWFKKHSFRRGGEGGDFAAWLLGLGVGLFAESPEVIGISRRTAWMILAAMLALSLGTRLFIQPLRKTFGRLRRWLGLMMHRLKSQIHRFYKSPPRAARRNAMHKASAQKKENGQF